MTGTIAKAISKRNIIYLEGISIAVSTALYYHPERRVARRGMAETVSEYVNNIPMISLLKATGKQIITFLFVSIINKPDVLCQVRSVTGLYNKYMQSFSSRII